MVDIIIHGKATFQKEQVQEFLKDLDALFVKYETRFHGNIQSYEFEECELIIDEETNN